jgi:hypothetical protein
VFTVKSKIPGLIPSSQIKISIGGLSITGTGKKVTSISSGTIQAPSVTSTEYVPEFGETTKKVGLVAHAMATAFKNH